MKIVFQPHLWPTILIFFILSITLIVFDLVFYPDTLEDAFITFRYSKHLAEGYGLGAWNIGHEKVEGYSTFLWMLILSAGVWVGLSIVTTAKILGIVLHLATCWLFLFFPTLSKSSFSLLGRQQRSIFLLSALFIAFYLPLTWYATSGMESMLFILLISLTLLGPFLPTGRVITPIVACLLVLTRPEGVLFALALGGFHTIYSWFSDSSVKPAIWGIVLPLACYILMLALRLAIFGEPFPNTYYAKVAGAGLFYLRYGLFDIFSWAFFHILITMTLIFTGVVLFKQLLTTTSLNSIKEGLNKNLLPLFMVSFILMYIIYIVKIGGDDPNAFPYWRHMLHLSPFWILLLSTGLVIFMPDPLKTAQIGLMLVILVVTNYHLQSSNPRMMAILQKEKQPFRLDHFPHNGYYLWLDALTNDKTTIASSLAGELPYVVDAVHIDILGLNDYHIAHYGQYDPDGPPDSKTDMGYVLQRKPDIIEGFISGRAIIANLPPEKIITSRKKMVFDMLAQPYFRDNYVLLINGPYHHFDRALFFHKAWVENHPQKEELVYIPVTETSLYR